MKKKESLPFLFFALFLIASFSLSCGDDRTVVENEAYLVDIQIVSPNNNTTLAVGEKFKVEVDYSRTNNIIHNIKVEIVDMAGNSVRKLVERHAHVANEFTFISDEISIDQAGTYLIKASTTDLEDGSDAGSKEDSEITTEHQVTVQ